MLVLFGDFSYDFNLECFGWWCSWVGTRLFVSFRFSVVACVKFVFYCLACLWCSGAYCAASLWVLCFWVFFGFVYNVVCFG